MIKKVVNLPPQTFEIKLDFEQLTLHPSDLCTVIGYPPGESPPHIVHAVDQILEQAKSLVQIRGGYRCFDDLQRDDDHVHCRIGGVAFEVGKIISTQLRKASGALLFVCTIGDGLENYARSLMKEGDYVAGFVADMIASETVEAAMDAVQNALEAEFRQQGLRLTNRYSPGYCGWHVSEQQKLFSLLPPQFCGITLTPSSLMVPIKSVSGVIGIGAEVRKVDYTCRFCDMKDCIYRRKYEKAAARA